MSTHNSSATPRQAAAAGGAIAGRFFPLPITSVTIARGFWAERQRVNREQTIPHIYQQCQRTGRIAALRGIWSPELVAHGVGGSNIPVLFWDSDVAKWIEAASYSLATHPDPQLDAQLDRVIELLGQAQQPDG